MKKTQDPKLQIATALERERVGFLAKVEREKAGFSAMNLERERVGI